MAETVFSILSSACIVRFPCVTYVPIIIFYYINRETLLFSQVFFTHCSFPENVPPIINLYGELEDSLRPAIRCLRIVERRLH